jgi:predicted DNA-binding protein (UPF0278 family)
VQLHFALARFEATAARHGIPINLIYEHVQDVERRIYRPTAMAVRALRRLAEGDARWYEEFIVNRVAGAVVQAMPNDHASGRAGHDSANPGPAPTTDPATSGASEAAFHRNGE